MVNWSQADRDLLVALNAAHADKSLEQLTKIFNSQAECKSRTSTALAMMIERLDAEPRRGRNRRLPRTSVQRGPATSPELFAPAAYRVGHKTPDTESEARTMSSDDSVESDTDDDQADQDFEILDSPATSTRRTPATGATRKRSADQTARQATFNASDNADNPTTKVSPDEDLIKTLESHLSHSALLIELKRRKVG